MTNNHFSVSYFAQVSITLFFCAFSNFSASPVFAQSNCQTYNVEKAGKRPESPKGKLKIDNDTGQRVRITIFSPEGTGEPFGSYWFKVGLSGNVVDHQGQTLQLRGNWGIRTEDGCSRYVSGVSEFKTESEVNYYIVKVSKLPSSAAQAKPAGWADVVGGILGAVLAPSTDSNNKASNSTKATSTGTATDRTNSESQLPKIKIISNKGLAYADCLVRNASRRQRGMDSSKATPYAEFYNGSEFIRAEVKARILNTLVEIEQRLDNPTVNGPTPIFLRDARHYLLGVKDEPQSTDELRYPDDWKGPKEKRKMAALEEIGLIRNILERIGK